MAATSRQTRIKKALKAAFRPELATGGEDTVKVRVCAGSTCNATGPRGRERRAHQGARQARPLRHGPGRPHGLPRPLPGGPHRRRPPARASSTRASRPRTWRRSSRPAWSATTSSSACSIATRRRVTRSRSRRTCRSTPVRRASCAPRTATSIPRRSTTTSARGGYTALAQGARRRRARRRRRRGRALAACAAAAAPGSRPARKWRYCRANPGEKHYLIANGDEGDPGAFMDRAMLEDNPHSVVEGMLIGAFAIGADRGLRLRPPRVPAGRLAPAPRSGAGARTRPAGRRHPRHRLELRPQDQPGRRRVRLRRVHGAHGLHRGAPRHAARQAHPHGRPRPLGPADRPQQRRDARQRPLDRAPTAPTPSRRWAPTRPRARRSSRSPARCGTPASSRCPWAPPCARSSSTSAAACRTAASSRPCSSAGPAAAACRPTLLDTPIDFENLTKYGSMMGSGGMVVVDDEHLHGRLRQVLLRVHRRRRAAASAYRAASARSACSRSSSASPPAWAPSTTSNCSSSSATTSSKGRCASSAAAPPTRS